MRGSTQAFSEPHDDHSGVQSLFQQVGGLIASSIRFTPFPGEPALVTHVVHGGDLRQLRSPTHTRACRSARPVIMSGAGTSDHGSSLFLAIIEELERYSGCVCESDQFVVASANDLGSEAMDIDLIARCSDAEISNPACPLRLPDKNGRIRWVRGVSLLDGRITYVPAVMVYMRLGEIGSSERFWHSLSTGCAAHTSYEGALVNAICEVIERDAISLVWLQRLPLPKIDIDVLSGELGRIWGRYQRSSSHLAYSFFDATLDIGMPTVYALQIAPADHRVTTLVACSTAPSASAAVAKTIRDFAGLRIAFRNPRKPPDDINSFEDIMDGATYMASGDRVAAFEFLLDTPRRRLSELPDFDNFDQSIVLRSILNLLRLKGMHAYAVDLTTDEALRVGVRVVRVIIPELQPLSFIHRARFLGHRRLYEAPIAIGYSVHDEHNLNPWPQAFA